MTLKKGDRVQTEDGDVGEILFVDKGGLEAQVALERISLKIRTDSLVKLSSQEKSAPVAAPLKTVTRAAKRPRSRRSTQS
jgi:preprotein translocase subunit YajC